MNFAWAMDMVLNQERAVRRTCWHSGEFILLGEDFVMTQYLKTEIYEPTQYDLMAEDWVEVLEV